MLTTIFVSKVIIYLLTKFENDRCGFEKWKGEENFKNASNVDHQIVIPVS